ncbi:globin domain-containing protein [Pseudonocardia sp. CA-107938]|uniref:globin domain-containing protein n=1 Tax=Pseudonocardia sp. CA-107938 TaxID=3240021 RepID=UPI003D8A1852
MASPVNGLPPTRPAPEAIAAVRLSLQAVAERPVELAERFYKELFAMEPRLREAFPADMSGQMFKMTETLVGAIAALDEPDLDVLEQTLRDLGRTHAVRYGVENWQYGYIGHALTRAVREVAGPSFSGSMSSSWIALYQWVAGHMIAGADASRARAAAEERVPTIPAQLPRPIERLPQPRHPRDARIAGQVR